MNKILIHIVQTNLSNNNKNEIFYTNIFICLNDQDLSIENKFVSSLSKEIFLDFVDFCQIFEN